MWLLADTETQIMIQTTVPVEGEGIKIPTTAKIGVVEIKMIVEIGATEIRMITIGRITDAGEIIAMIVMIVRTEMVDATAEEVTEMTPTDRLIAPTEGMEVEVHPAGLTPAVAEVTETDLEMTRTMAEGHPAVPIETVETTEETHLLAVLTHPARMRRTPTQRAPTPEIIMVAVGEVEVPMSD